MRSLAQTLTLTMPKQRYPKSEMRERSAPC